ncbi:MAG: hypothetical protein ABL934_09875 [Lysobacteraceae bacterium]
MTPERAAIVATLQAVPNIGVVHAYERTAADLAKMKQLYYSAAHNQIRGWFIRRVRVREIGLLQPVYLEVTEWQIRGFMSIDDSAGSELVMDSLIEAVRDGLRANNTLTGTVRKLGLLQSGAERGLQLEDFGPYMFGGVLCHGARLALTTTKELTQTGSSTTVGD